MTCNPILASELPGSYVTCAQIIVRECLSINGIEVIPGAATVHTDGVTMQGDGSLATPVALKAVQHDLTLVGLGTVGSPLSVPAGPPATVITDGVTMQGDGSGGAPVAIKRVETNPGGIQSINGAGTVLDPLFAVALQGGGSGFVDTTQVVAGVPLIAAVTPSGNIALQAGAGGLAGAGGIALTVDASQGQALVLGSTGNNADIDIGSLVGAAHDNPRMFSFDVRDCGGLANIGPGPAGTARFAYDLATNKVYVSLNGAAFVAIVTL